MQAKDVALLGFVSSAQEYVRKHIEDKDRLGDLKNINIDRLKGDLLSQLKFYTGEDANDLINAGRMAFEDFKNENLIQERNSIIDQLGELFDAEAPSTDLIEDEDVATGKINNLLKTYDTDEAKEEVTPIKKIDEPFSYPSAQVSYDFINFEGKAPQNAIDDILGLCEESSDESSININDFGVNQNSNKEKKVDIKFSIDELISEGEQNKELEEKPHDENENFGLADDDEFLKAISAAASKTDEELAEQVYVEPQVETKAPVHPKNMDEVYSDVVNNEANQQSEIEEKEDIQQTENEEDETLSSRLSSYRENDKVDPESFEKKKEEILTSVIQTAVKKEEPQTVRHLSDELKNYGHPVSPIEQPSPSDLGYIVNPGLNIVEEIEKQSTISSSISNLKNDDVKEEIKQEEPQEEIEEEASTANNYGVFESLDDLKEFAKAKVNEKKKEEFDPNADIYNNIAVMFEHLNLEFIKSAYALKQELADTLKEGQAIVLLHRIRFSDLEELQSFVEIAVSHDYAVNVDEKQMIVDVFKDYINTEGLVLGTIFTIANQAALLEGEYEGYRVIDNEGK